MSVLLIRCITAFLIGFTITGCAGTLQNAIFGKCHTFSTQDANCRR